MRNAFAAAGLLMCLSTSQACYTVTPGPGAFSAPSGPVKSAPLRSAQAEPPWAEIHITNSEDCPRDQRTSLVIQHLGEFPTNIVDAGFFHHLFDSQNEEKKKLEELLRRLEELKRTREECEAQAATCAATA